MYYVISDQTLMSMPPRYTYKVYEDKALAQWERDLAVDMTREGETLDDLLARLFELDGTYAVSVIDKNGKTIRYDMKPF